MAELEHIRPDGLANHPAYTQVVAALGARHVYISGQVAVDPDGAPVGKGDLAAQTEQVMRNVGTALAAAGATFDDVVKITTFVVGYTPEMRSIIGEIRGRHLPADNPPASTLVGVSALAGADWLIEIEAVAVTD